MGGGHFLLEFAHQEEKKLVSIMLLAWVEGLGDDLVEESGLKVLVLLFETEDVFDKLRKRVAVGLLLLILHVQVSF